MASESQLLSAVLTNDIDTVKNILSQPESVEDHELERQAALHVAVIDGRTSMVRLLLDTGLSPSLQDPTDSMWFRQPIHHAAAKGHLSVVKILLEAGADVNSGDHESRTPLHWAATSGAVETAQYLVENGAAVNFVQKDGFTALHAATCLGHMSMCKYLLSAGSEINRADRDGWSPLHMATCYGHPEILQMFLASGARVNQKTRDDETALHIAVDPGKPDVFEQIQNVGENSDDGLQTCADLFSRAARSNKHLAACYLNLKQICDAGATLEVKNMQGYTPFLLAVWRSKYSAACYLINLGCDVNTRNSAGHSALYICTVRAATDILRLIVAAGCNIQSETWIHESYALQALSKHKDIQDWLKNCYFNPMSLSHICCTTIRKSMEGWLPINASLLPLPRKLKSLISLAEYQQIIY